MAAVLGISPWRSAVELFAEKTGALERDDRQDDEWLEWGLRLEPVIMTAFAQRTGRPIRKSGELLRSLEHDWALSTLDGWTGESVPDWPLEVKTTAAYGADEWTDGPPEHYVVQVQHQMLVTGTDRATIACLIGGQRMVWCDVERDEAMIRKIVHHGREFWDRVTRGVPPEPDGSQSAANGLTALYRQDDGSTVALPPELMEDADALADYKASRKAIDSNVLGIENRIKAALGTAKRGVLPNGHAFSWSTEHRAAYTVEASTRRVLRAHAPKTK